MCIIFVEDKEKTVEYAYFEVGMKLFNITFYKYYYNKFNNIHYLASNKIICNA